MLRFELGDRFSGRDGFMRFLKLSSVMLASAIALSGLQTTLAQEPRLVLEMTIGETGRTVFRCSASDGLRSEAVDCSGNTVQQACNGETVTVDRNNGGACFIEEGTELDNAALDLAQQETSRILLIAE